MRKLYLAAVLLIIVPLTGAINLQMSAETPDRVLYSNETVETNISVENLDTRAAEDTDIILEVGKRNFTYEVGTIEPGEEFNKTLKLPEYPAGSYQAKMTVNYTGFLDTKYTETTRSGFKVQYPDFVRIPRLVYLQGVEVPENITAGEEKEIEVGVKHDGDIEGAFITAIASNSSEKSRQTDLSPGDQRNMTINRSFYQPGVSFAEARLYADVNSDLFLLDYISRQIFVKENRVAQLDIAASNVKEQGSRGELEVKLENNGENPAYEINTTLKSENLEVESTSDPVNLLSGDESENISFTVSNPTSSETTFSPEIEISYRDGAGYHNLQQNLSLNLESSSVDVRVEESNVETNEDGSTLSLTLENEGQGDAENLQLQMQSQSGISLSESSVNVGSLEAGSSTQVDGFSFSILKSSVSELDLDIDASYDVDSGQKTTKLSTAIEGGYNEGSVCSSDWQCGTSQDPMMCSPSSSGSNSRCCPAGQTYSDSAGSCLEKLTLVAVPIFYNEGEFQEFKQVTEEQVQFFAEKSPLKEVENPRSRIEVKYIKPSEVENPGTKDCGQLNRFAQDIVLDSKHRNSYDKIIATTKEFSKPGLLGCAYPFSDMEVTLESHPKTMAHEIAHSFGFGHTQGYMSGCGATRSNRDYLNDPQDDGPGEIMNYCPGDNYFSEKSDEYTTLKQIFKQNGWL